MTVGIASYNRGTSAVVRSIRHDFERGRDADLFADLTEISSVQTDSPRLPGDRAIRQGDGGWWLMAMGADGYRRNAFWYRSLRTMARGWRMAFVGWSRDECGEFILVTTTPA